MFLKWDIAPIYFPRGKFSPGKELVVKILLHTRIASGAGSRGEAIAIRKKKGCRCRCAEVQAIRRRVVRQ